MPLQKERGKWHEFNEDWGETFPGKTNPVPYVVDLPTGKVRALPVPANISFGQLRWLPDGKHLVAIGWETTKRRLGASAIAKPWMLKRRRNSSLIQQALSIVQTASQAFI